MDNGELSTGVGIPTRTPSPPDNLEPLAGILGEHQSQHERGNVGEGLKEFFV